MFFSGNFESEYALNAPIFIGVSVVTLYVYCLLGAIVSDYCLRFSDILYDSMWYNLDVSTEKFLILMIANMNKPLEFDGYYIVPLNLITFTKV